MKINIDTEDFFTTRRIAWFLFIVAAVVLIFHLGMLCGARKAKKDFYRHMKHMHSKQLFDVRMPQGGMPIHMQPGEHMIYYNGNAMMGAGAAAAKPVVGGRIIKMDQGAGEEKVIIFKSQ